jgi:hypothetical protein
MAQTAIAKVLAEGEKDIKEAGRAHMHHGDDA